MSDLISRQAAIDTLLKWMWPICINNEEVIESDDMVAVRNILKSLPSAQPEPCLDLIVSEIEETIRETKENGKHHEIHVRINGEMICFGLQLALEIIEEKRNERSDRKTSGD